MMQEESDETVSDAVGYGKPPKANRFKKGQSGNPAGAPKRRRKAPVNVATILNEPVKVRQSGKTKKIQPFEAMVRKLVEKSLKDKDVRAIGKLLMHCEKYGQFAEPVTVQNGGVIFAPKGVSPEDWVRAQLEQTRPEPAGTEADFPEYSDGGPLDVRKG